MVCRRRRVIEGNEDEGNSDAINNSCTFHVETVVVLHGASTIGRQLSTGNPHEFRVFESLDNAIESFPHHFVAVERVEQMGKKSSQDSSTCDINTKRHRVWRESITTYNVLDIYPQKLST